MKGLQPPDARGYPRFCGIRTFMRLPHCDNINGVDFVIVGVPFDTGASYRVGARFAPEAIRSASVLLRACHPVHGIDIFDHLSGVDYGDLPVAPGFTEDSIRRIEESFDIVVRSKAVPICMGGDHTISLPLLRVLARHHGPLGLLHLDSHSDTWDDYFGHRLFHGTPFRRAAEEGLIDPQRTIQVGIRGSLYELSDIETPRKLGFEVIRAEELIGQPLGDTIRRIRERLGDGKTYLSLDIDVLDPAFAPATGTPEIGGPTSAQIQAVLRGLLGVRFVGMDLVEVLPELDQARLTSLTAATMIHEFLSLMAMQKASTGRAK